MIHSISDTNSVIGASTIPFPSTVINLFCFQQFFNEENFQLSKTEKTNNLRFHRRDKIGTINKTLLAFEPNVSQISYRPFSCNFHVIYIATYSRYRDKFQYRRFSINEFHSLLRLLMNQTYIILAIYVSFPVGYLALSLACAAVLVGKYKRIFSRRPFTARLLPLAAAPVAEVVFEVAQPRLIPIQWDVLEPKKSFVEYCHVDVVQYGASGGG